MFWTSHSSERNNDTSENTWVPCIKGPEQDQGDRRTPQKHSGVSVPALGLALLLMRWVTTLVILPAPQSLQRLISNGEQEGGGDSSFSLYGQVFSLETS